MDVSVIDEMPAGRKQIETYWVKHDMLDRILAFVEKELKQGRQAYIICPLIEESDKLDVQNAIDVYNMLSDIFRGNGTSVLCTESRILMKRSGHERIQRESLSNSRINHCC